MQGQVSLRVVLRSLLKQMVELRVACGNRYLRQTTRIFVAHPIVSAVSFGFVNCAFFPARSCSATPRAVAHARQTYIGIFNAITFAKASLNGGHPTGITLSDTELLINTASFNLRPGLGARTRAIAGRVPTAILTYAYDVEGI